MKTKAFVVFSACALVGAATAVEVKPYDFNSIAATGSGSGVARLEIDGKVVEETTVDGSYELVAEGLTPGQTYAYEFSLGAERSSGTILLGNEYDGVFAADAPSGQTVGGAWDVVPAVSAGAYQIAASNRFEITARKRMKLVTVDSLMTFADGDADMQLVPEGLGAFTLAQKGIKADDYYWAGLGSGEWKTLKGADAAPGAYVVRMEFDLNVSPARVRYSLKGTGEETFVILKSGTREWLDVAVDAAAVASVAYEGSGSVVGFEGDVVNFDVAQVGEATYEEISGALQAGSSVKLLTNTRPSVGRADAGKSWSIDANGCAFSPIAGPGCSFTYSAGVFSISEVAAYVVVTEAAAEYGTDFTNGALKVSFDGFVESDNPFTLKYSIFTANGSLVASGQRPMAGVSDQMLSFPTDAASIAAKESYTYEIQILNPDGKLETSARGTLLVGRSTNWFDAEKGRWSVDGVWTKNGDETTVEGASISLGADEYAFLPVVKDSVGSIVCVDAKMTVGTAVESDELPVDSDAQGLITVGKSPTGDASWMAYVGGEWKPLTGSGTAPGTYTVRAELDYQRLPRRVRFSVAKEGGAFAVLSCGGEEWLQTGKDDATTLVGMSATGNGSLYAVCGSLLDASVAQIGSARYESLGKALAVADGAPVDLLWDCSADNPPNGSWAVRANGHSLFVGGKYSYFDNDILRVTDAAVAQIGDVKYGFLDQAFASAAAKDTVVMLQDLVQDCDVIQSKDRICLDLAGKFVSFADGKKLMQQNSSHYLIVTNSTRLVGGFGGTISGGKQAIKGGKWPDNTSYQLDWDRYYYEGLNPAETVDGVVYRYEILPTWLLFGIW